MSPNAYRNALSQKKSLVDAIFKSYPHNTAKHLIASTLVELEALLAYAQEELKKLEKSALKESEGKA